jgi:hypothetical protein
MKPEQPFEIQIDGQDYPLELGKCAVVLFRRMSQVDYIMLDHDGDTVRGFNNPDMAHWLAGYRLRVDEDGDIVRDTILLNDQTFRARFGFNPLTIEKEEPSETELEGFMDVATRDLDDDLREIG